MKLCDRCSLVGTCALDYLGRACERYRAQFAPDIVPNNAEVLCNMDYEALARTLFSIEYRRAIDGGGAQWSRPDDAREWLLQPAMSSTEVSDFGG